MRKHVSTITTVLVFLAGLSLLLYPTFSNWWNASRQSQAISDYAGKVDEMDAEEYARLWREAWEYNRALAEQSTRYALTEEQKERYEKLLNVSGDGIMAYIEIPKIGCRLPIYHGTKESALQIAAGHLEWSSLPVGGESAHCVISGHRGLPRAKLFTDLDKMEEGDQFFITVLNKRLTYEVDQIQVVEPEEVEDLTIEKGKDYVTLVTCTPYAINTHRLLVRGRRIETPDKLKHIRVTADAIKIEPIITAPIMALPLLLVLLLWLLFSNRKRKSTRGEKHETH